MMIILLPASFSPYPFYRFRDGKEPFYIGLNGELMVAEISTIGAAFQSGVPKLLFQLSGEEVCWSASSNSVCGYWPKRSLNRRTLGR
jgi:hypothetical protein